MYDRQNNSTWWKGGALSVLEESEVQEYLQGNRRFRQLLPRAALVGLSAGGLAVAFRIALVNADIVRHNLVQWLSQSPEWGWLGAVLFSAIGALLSVVIMRRYAPDASGSGIPHLKGVLHRLRDMHWVSIIWVKFVGGVLALGAGLGLGREGPTVQMGGAIGDAIGRRLKVSTRERLTLTAAGAGAGLAAAFNAPLSGVIFVLEELQRDFQPAVFGAVFVAAAVADIVARFVAGQYPVFAIPSYASPPLESLPMFILLGVVCGVFGVVFNRSLLFFSGWSTQLTAQRRLWFALAVGATAGYVAWVVPILAGSGHALAEELLSGHTALALIPLYLMIRFGLTLASYATGAPGGIFAPLLVLGALLGAAIGQVAMYLIPTIQEPAVFAVVGMAALFTGIVRAPLTGVVLIIEMTGNYHQMLPLLVACFAAYAVAEYLRDIPIYEALLMRDLQRNGVTSRHAKPVVAEYTVEAGAEYEGKMVRDLGWPAGCILVRCQYDQREIVPTANTVLLANMRITVVVPPQAANALAIIREGCDPFNE